MSAALAASLTRHGALVDPDSPTYLWTARVFAHDPATVLHPPTGTSLSIAGRYPPLYPLVLAALRFFGDELLAARALGIATAGAVGALVTWSVGRRSGPAAAALALVALWLVRGWGIVLFGFVMTDGLAVALSLGAVAAIVPQLEGPPPSVLRILPATALAAAATLTRWSGAGTVAGIAAAVAFLSPWSRRARASAAVAVVVGGLALPLGWQLIAGNSGTIGTRSLAWDGTFDPVRELLGTPAWAFLPGPVLDAVPPTAWQAAGFATLVLLGWWSVGVVRGAVPSRPDPTGAGAAVLVLVGWSSLASVLVARHLFDHLISVGGRHLALWQAALVCAGAIDLDRRRVTRPRAVRRRRTPLAAAVVAGVLVLSGGVLLARAVVDPVGAWWNIAQEPASPLAELVVAGDATTPVYTNREDLVFLAGGDHPPPTRRLPTPWDLDSSRPNRHYQDQLAQVAGLVARGKARIALFSGWSIPVEDVLHAGKVEVEARAGDGAIFGPATGGTEPSDVDDRRPRARPR